MSKTKKCQEQRWFKGLTIDNDDRTRAFVKDIS